jgi:hypothetical protein
MGAAAEALGGRRMKQKKQKKEKSKTMTRLSFLRSKCNDGISAAKCHWTFNDMFELLC